MPVPAHLSFDPEVIRRRSQALRGNKGLRAVSAWTLPNDDVKADDNELVREFQEDLDGLMEMTEVAINRMLSASDKQA